MTNHEDATDGAVLAYFSAGRDTSQIAALLGLPEADVANRLPRILERRRAGARKVLAAVERRVGVAPAVIRGRLFDRDRAPLGRRPGAA